MIKTAAIYTFGCRLNSADNGLINSRLINKGYKIVTFDEAKIDLIVVNSCAVTQEAVRKSRQFCRKMKNKHPKATIILCGCAATVGDWNGIVDYIVKDKREISNFLQEQLPEVKYNDVFEEKVNSIFPFNSRAFLKIQEGCNNFCSYCIVPYVRGRERSRSFNEVISDAKQLIKQGFPEIILTGVNSCKYNDNGRTLNNLIEEIAQIDGDFRIRLSSTEPDMDNIELLETMAKMKNRVCHFLHLSLQSGSNRILKLMRRHYSFEEYENFVNKARELMPNIHIGTDIIVGFPGETDEDFQISCANAQKIDFANTHIFSYSKREGTLAATFKEQIASNVIAKRYQELNLIAQNSKIKFIKKFVNQSLPVIFEEEKKDGFLHGWSDNYIAVKCEKNSFPLGKICDVKISSIDNNNILVADR